MPTDDLSTLQSEKPAYKYFVFISYSRKDSRAAKWLQKRLEWFRFPVKLVESDRRPNDPRYLRPVYRDKTNLEVDHAHYWENIKRAIEQSRFLIVLCSPDSAKSEPVDLEVSHFLSTRENAIEFIEPVILRGDVGTGGESECLCPNLRNLEPPITERNLPSMVPDTEDSEHEGWENGFVGVACYLLNLERKSLRDHVLREERKRVAKARVLAALFAVLALGAVTSAVVAYRNGIEARKQRADAMVARDRETAAKLDAETRRKEAEIARDLEAKQKALAEQKTVEAEKAQRTADEQRHIAEAQTLVANEQRVIASENEKKAIEREALVHFNNALSQTQNGHSFEALQEAAKALRLQPEIPGPLAITAELVSRKWWPILISGTQLDADKYSYYLANINRVFWLENELGVFFSSAVDEKWSFANYVNSTVEYQNSNSAYLKAVRSLPAPLRKLDFKEITSDRAKDVFYGTLMNGDIFACKFGKASGEFSIGRSSKLGTEQTDYILGYNEGLRQLQGANIVSGDGNKRSVEIVNVSIVNGGITTSPFSVVDLGENDTGQEVRVIGFVNRGKAVLVSATDRTWLLGSDVNLDLPRKNVERVTCSSSGRFAAIVSQDSEASYGSTNFRVSVIDFDLAYANNSEIETVA